MPKRYVVIAERTGGETAEMALATMQELGLKDKDDITINAPTTIFTLTVVAGTVGLNQIKLPRKAPSVLKEGDRITVEPASEPAPALAPDPRPKPGMSTKLDPSKVEWDPLMKSDFDEIAGLGQVKSRIEQALFYLTHPEWFLILQNLPPRVFLFFGPYGCGKTMLAKAMASKLSTPGGDGCTLDVKLKVIKSTDIKDPYLGMSAKHVEQYISAAREACNKGSTVLLMLDEIDSLVGNRADGNTHEEYRDIVNSVIQDIQGLQELDTESRIRRLWKDKQVVDLRKQIAQAVRHEGVKDQKGDINLPQQKWTADVRNEMSVLRKKIVDEGGVSTVIVVGTTNDPTRIDEAFISRAGDNVFFVSRPSADAIQQMLEQQLDTEFFELKDSERKDLAKAAFEAGLTGRDIMLSWLQPLRNRAPGSLSIVGAQTVKAHMPRPVVGIEWEMDLYQRLKVKGHLQMADQVGDYLEEVRGDRDGGTDLGSSGKPAKGNGKAIAPFKSDSKQPALFTN
ncbi:MAG: ATP-binding protein [Chloroflexi bacterium]|nr:ATP-binding protein [Chloroflexota bacterium]